MKYLLASVLFCLQASSFAADTLSFQHNDVVFSEKRLSGLESRDGVEIIGAQAIRQMPVKTIADMLNYISGVDLNQRGVFGVQADVSLDGANFEETLLLIDGIPMRDPQTGHHMMNLPISLSDVDHIEIIHGAAGRIYGSNALAGAINIVTKAVNQSTSYVDVSSGIQAANNNSTNPLYQIGNVQAGVKFGRKNFYHNVSLQAQAGNGYRYNTDVKMLQGSYRAQYFTKNQNSFKSHFSFIKNAFGANAFYAAPYDADAGESVDTYLGSIQGNIKKGKWAIMPSIYSRYNEDHYVFIRSMPSIYENRHFTSSSGALLDFNRSNALGKLGGGIETRVETIHSNNLGVHQRYYTNGFLDQFWQYSKTGSVTFGLNAQYNKFLGWSFFPGLDWKQKITKNTNVFANVGTGNRLATFTELYYTDRANTSNDSLQAERAQYVSLGIKRRGRLSYEAYLFNRSINNFISYSRGSETEKWTPNNIAQVNMQGLNINGSYQFCKWSSLNFAYTYLKADFISSNTNEFKYSYEHAKHRVVVSIYQSFGKHFNQTISYRYVERFNANHYQVLDYRLNYLVTPQVRAYMDLTNALNASYYDRVEIPMPARWIRLGISASF